MHSIPIQTAPLFEGLTRRVCRAAAALLLVLAAGCAAFDKGEPDPTWLSAEVSAPSENVLRIESIGAFERMGFKKWESDPSGLQITSNWKSSLAPFSGDGFRVKAEIKFESVRAGVWTVEVRVKRMFNMAMINPSEERYAEWEWGPDDVEEAGILLQQLRSSLDPVDDFEVGESTEKTFRP